MKKNYKNMAFVASFLMASLGGFAQESPEKPIKKLKVYDESEQFSLSNSKASLQNQFALPS
ncbi:MAG TPA: hypothetical protein EYN16_05570, partial [Flavobacteriaceae bacterium]|nr:hypothetical protein [Flavobacteriaceae bacterium]